MLVLFVYEVCLSCSILIWLSGFKVFHLFLVCISFLDIEIEVSSLVFLLNNIAKPIIHIICEHPLNFGCNLFNMDLLKGVTKWRYEGQIQALGVHVSIALVIVVSIYLYSVIVGVNRVIRCA